MKWAVELMEYERGWGSRLDETVYFDTEREANDYIKKFNAQNTAPTAPDWYMVATGPFILTDKPKDK